MKKTLSRINQCGIEIDVALETGINWESLELTSVVLKCAFQRRKTSKHWSRINQCGIEIQNLIVFQKTLIVSRINQCGIEMHTRTHKRTITFGLELTSVVLKLEKNWGTIDNTGVSN